MFTDKPSNVPVNKNNPANCNRHQYSGRGAHADASYQHCAGDEFGQSDSPYRHSAVRKPNAFHEGSKARDTSVHDPHNGVKREKQSDGDAREEVGPRKRKERKLIDRSAGPLG